MNIINLLLDRVLPLLRVEIGRVARILHLHYQTARFLSCSNVRVRRDAAARIAVIARAAQVLFGTITMMQVAVRVARATRMVIVMVPVTMFVVIMMLVVCVHKTPLKKMKRISTFKSECKVMTTLPEQLHWHWEDDCGVLFCSD